MAAGYASDIMEAFNKDVFPYIGNKPIAQIKPLYTGSKLVLLAARLLILTGVRTGELRAANWQEIDTENALWEIPVTNGAKLIHPSG
ncbi:hypothetical protein DDI_3198 [Dickeya dianthicola RNS04.9]|nr:hypothetical protein DDI_3198 [Dickeya dianthicola RNS04.9]